MTTRKQIERRWGMPFDDLVRDFAEQDLTRKQTAQALGMTAPALSQLLINNDPFPPLCRAGTKRATDSLTPTPLN